MSLACDDIREALAYGARPDPARGVFETIAVLDGELSMPGTHLKRLAASARELYGLELPEGLGKRLEREARGHNGRLRVALTPDGAVEVGRAQRGAPSEYSSIAPFVLAGGLGRHKWSDRRLVDAIGQAAGAGGLALLIDVDGAVLEAGWANVLIEERGELITPVRDGRLRPGVGCERHEFREEPVGLERLLEADGLLLTSALRDVWVWRAGS